MCCRHCVLKEHKKKRARKEVVPNKGNREIRALVRGCWVAAIKKK